jgi:hypothetical protein|tara:strand:+ start:910 stop:1236 length:327 start_codon:yes stop_codon:yes gene_type:complete
MARTEQDHVKIRLIDPFELVDAWGENATWIEFSKDVRENPGNHDLRETRDEPNVGVSYEEVPPGDTPIVALLLNKVYAGECTPEEEKLIDDINIDEFELEEDDSGSEG